MPGRCSSIFTGRHIERHQVPAFYTERFEWHGDWPPEPSPPLAVTDDKLDLSRRSAYHLPNVAERLGVKIEHWHANEIANSRGLRKALEITLLHRHGILLVHHPGPWD